MKARAAVLLALAFAGSAVGAERRLDCGLDRSNLVWEPPATQAQALDGIAALRARWFRDDLTPTPGFVRELGLAKARGLKFLAVVNPSLADYPAGYKPPNGGVAFAKRCGWASGSPEISKIDLVAFQARLKSEFAAVKAAGLTIDAFEIGNEFDWICFNGDVPDGHEASVGDFDRLVAGYARYFNAATAVIRDPAYFPRAAVITFGLAEISGRFDTGHHIAEPERILAALRHLDATGIDGAGLHIYPGPGQDPERIRQAIAAASAASGGWPVWITEWGFSLRAFAKGGDAARAGAIRRFHALLAGVETPLGPNFFYAYSEHTDAGHGLDGAANTAAEHAFRQACQP